MKLDEKTAILLLNTGSAAAPETAPTREYLRQFLSDPRIIDIAGWKRWLLVNLLILPTRPPKTAEAYKQIWTERGSPLVVFSEDFRDALAKRLNGPMVEIGMAYGTHRIKPAIDALLAKNPDRLVVVPMFPQYASATTGSVLECVYKYCAEKWNVPAITVIPEYFDDPGYIDAWKQVAQPALDEFKPDHVLLSFHGLPERQLRKCDPSGSHCLAKPDCCEQQVDANIHCYRRQCMETGKAIAAVLGLQPGQYTVTFQSRLGRDPWLTPATDETIGKRATEGVRRLAILSPAFVADCLETLEEIGIGGKETFEEHGGEHYLLVPSLNAHPRWVEALAAILERH